MTFTQCSRVNSLVFKAFKVVILCATYYIQPTWRPSSLIDVNEEEQCNHVPIVQVVCCNAIAALLSGLVACPHRAAAQRFMSRSSPIYRYYVLVEQVSNTEYQILFMALLRLLSYSFRNTAGIVVSAIFFVQILVLRSKFPVFLGTFV